MTLRVATDYVGEIERLRAEVVRLTAAREQLEVQLAGCGVAALGWSAGCNKAAKGDYGWSTSYGDVVTLREDRDRLRGVLEQIADMESEGAGARAKAMAQFAVG